MLFAGDNSANVWGITWHNTLPGHSSVDYAAFGNVANTTHGTPEIQRWAVPFQLDECVPSCLNNPPFGPAGRLLSDIHVDQVTYQQLESLDLVPSVILSADMTGHSSSTLSSMHDVNPNWTRIELKCLNKALFYREGFTRGILESTIVWSFEDIGSQSVTTNKWNTIKIGESFLNGRFLDQRGNDSLNIPVQSGSKQQHSTQDTPPSETINLSSSRIPLSYMLSKNVANLSSGKAHPIAVSKLPTSAGIEMPRSIITDPIPTSEVRSIGRHTTQTLPTYFSKQNPSSNSALNVGSNVPRSDRNTSVSYSGIEIVQFVTALIGTMATVIGTLATVALWMDKNKKSRGVRSGDQDVESQDFNPDEDDGLPPADEEDEGLDGFDDSDFPTTEEFATLETMGTRDRPTNAAHNPDLPDHSTQFTTQSKCNNLHELTTFQHQLIRENAELRERLRHQSNLLFSLLGEPHGRDELHLGDYRLVWKEWMTMSPLEKLGGEEKAIEVQDRKRTAIFL
ncbi:hypothetical protein DM02DRAFT_661712 [Periconia macrospinosa]|uniref:Uncharacterized protein n=1 Tax=Periconia macrospinosa TaxID=97972 RepID=A0A2V1D837_9PLEO|nr:hypothetical protein DM02DRAFT_661712 [Periconia macrospinosa]